MCIRDRYQCNGALGAAKEAGRSPRELATAILDGLSDRSIFASLEIAGPGFINIVVTDEYLAGYADAMENDERFGIPDPDPRHKVLVCLLYTSDAADDL